MHVRLGVIRLMWSDDFHVFIFFEIASNNKLKMETKSHGKTLPRQKDRARAK